jgi:hypothetical protein
MILASWNVNSISVRLPYILEWLQEVNSDVVCLEETKSVDEKFPLAQLNEAGYRCCFSGEHAYNGVAILSKLPAENIQKGFIGEEEPFSRRFIEVKTGPIYMLSDATWASVSTTSGPLLLFVKKFLVPGLTNHPGKRSGHQILRRSLPNFQFDASSICRELNCGGLFCL